MTNLPLLKIAKDMALSISLPFEDSYCYTHQLQELLINSSSAQVRLDINIVFINNDSRLFFFSSTYYTHLNSVTVYDLGSLMEAYMLQTNNCLTIFEITATAGEESDIKTLTVVYCKQNRQGISASELLNSRFLTNRTTRLTYLSATEHLSFFRGLTTGIVSNTVSVKFICFYQFPTGGIATRTFYIHYIIGRGSIGSIYVNPSANVSGQYIPTNASLIAYTVKTGKFKAKFYVSQQTDIRTFVFHNAYNVREYLNIPTNRTTKTTTKSSTARYGSLTEKYDIEHTRTYEEQTTVHTLEDAALVEEFLLSPSVKVVIKGTEYDILITDYTFEVSDNPGTGNTVKFEWQFADSRNTLPTDEYQRIFQEEYQEQFQ